MRDIILVFFGGGLGSVIRFGLGKWVNAFHNHHFPWGTLAVNVVACFLMGLLIGLADHKQPEARPLGLLAKVNASETAFECCRLAGEILGGASIMHEHPVEKYLRDASSFLHSDGTNQVCLLRASQAIASQGHMALYGF